LLFTLTGALFGIHRVYWSRASSNDALSLFFSTVAAGVAALGINEWLCTVALPPLAIVAASVLAFTGLVAVRYRSRLLSGLALRWLESRSSASLARERVLIVGGGFAGQTIAWILGNGPDAAAFHIVGFVDDDLFKQGIRFSGLDVLGKRMDIPPLVQKHDVGLIIYAINNIPPAEREEVLEICRRTPARVVISPDVAGIVNQMVQTGKTPPVTDSSVRPGTADAQEPLLVPNVIMPISSSAMHASAKASSSGK